MNKPNRLVIAGAGAFGRELMCWADRAVGATWGSMAWVDDNPQALDGFDYPLPWLGSFADYQPADGDLCVVSAGTTATKRRLVAGLQARGARFATLVHPSAIVARTARLGEGCVICPLAFVSADARLGAFVIVNGLSSVGHDVVLGAYSTLSAHVDLTGQVLVGEGAFFGTGAKVVPRVKIGSNAIVGAGATVMRTVPDGATVFTMPAKKL